MGARQPVWVRVAAQLIALAVIQLLLLVIAVLAAVPIEGVPDALLSVAPVFAALFVLSYLAGVVVPFSEDAPFGAALTTAVVLVAEVAWLAAESFLAQNAAGLVPAARVLIICGAVALALRLAKRDLRTS
ncbi:MAG TPA: hypothetical protein VNT53_09135 [Pseudolysinimonas sp.]|nr:hypothetical protein [Pseudolysinimonas sp.]